MAPQPRGRTGHVNRPLDLTELGRANADGTWDGVPTGTTIGHLHLKVNDLGAAQFLYRDVVGLERMQNVDDEAGFLVTAGYHHLGINTWYSRNAPT